MSKEFKFFIYLLERYAEHLGVTADIAYRRLAEKNLVDYAVDMYELYHVESEELDNERKIGLNNVFSICQFLYFLFALLAFVR